jgi:hypothetical protein
MDSLFHHATEQQEVMTPVVGLVQQQTARTGAESANKKSCGNEDLRDLGEVHTGYTKMSVLEDKDVSNHLHQSRLLSSSHHNAL